MRLVILVSERSSCVVDMLTTLVLRRVSSGHLQLIALGQLNNKKKRFVVPFEIIPTLS